MLAPSNDQWFCGAPAAGVSYSRTALLDAEALDWWLIYVSESGLDLKQNPLISHHRFTPALPPELTHSEWNSGSSVLSQQGNDAETPLPVCQGSPSSLLAVARGVTVLGWWRPGWNPKPGLHESCGNSLQEQLRSTEYLPKPMSQSVSGYQQHVKPAVMTSHRPLQVWEMPLRTHLQDRNKREGLRSLRCHHRPHRGFLRGREKCSSPWHCWLFYTREQSLLGIIGPSCKLHGCLVKGKIYNPLHWLRSVFLLVGGPDISQVNDSSIYYVRLYHFS